MQDRPVFERVTLDSGVLIGRRSGELLAAADLGYYRGYWSAWIAGEIARVRTELVALRAAKDRAEPRELRLRLERSRTKVNAYCDYCSKVLAAVDYTKGQNIDLSWLRDPDDHPVMRTAVAAGIPGTLCTDNKRDFPPGEVRNGVLILCSSAFLEALYMTYPDAQDKVAEYLVRKQGLAADAPPRITGRD